MSSLTALSPLDGRYAFQLSELRTLFSESALMKFRCQVEIEWLIFMSEQEILPHYKLNVTEINALREIFKTFSDKEAQEIKAIERTTNHDVKAIEYFLKARAEAFPFGKKIASFWHFCCTSEDINNLAYALMIKAAIEQVLLPELIALHSLLREQARENAKVPMLSRTHGQTASPTTLGKEIANFAYRLARQIKQLQNQDILGKFQGAVGNFNAHVVVLPELKWPHLIRQFVEELGLTYNPLVTQIEPHDFIAELAQNFSRINTIFLDLTRDFWTYISLDYFKLKVIEGEVGSSTMPHKVNPIDFENAEGNLGLANALYTHFAEKLPISRLQRDLTDSTVLRNVGTAFAYSLLAYRALVKGLHKTTPNLAKIESDLKNRYEVLTEALQTVLRYHGVSDAYEQMKAASRGQAFTRETYLACVESLTLPPAVKAALKDLTPLQYIGDAVALANFRLD